MKTLTEEKATIMSQPPFLTEEEFLELCDEDTKAEYIDGEVIVHSPASNQHGRISMFLGSIIQFYVDQYKLGTVWGDNFQVRLRTGLRRVPDMIFVSNENKVNISNTEIDGAPDLVIEIVSPDSVVRDWRDKYFDYEQAGVKEYWVIDPGNKRMEIYCLNKQRKYEKQNPEKGILTSKALPEFWLKPEWLWQEPLPNVLSIAKELKIKI